MRIWGNYRELLVGSLQVGSHRPQTPLGQHLLWEASQAPDLPAVSLCVSPGAAGAMCEVSTPGTGACGGGGGAPLYPRGTLVQGQPESDHLGSQPVQHLPRDLPTRRGQRPCRSPVRAAGEPSGAACSPATGCRAHTEDKRISFIVTP